jgi:hypothetical protein
MHSELHQIDGIQLTEEIRLPVAKTKWTAAQPLFRKPESAVFAGYLRYWNRINRK